MDLYRIVLADNHAMLRQGIRRIIERSKDMIVVGEVSDGLGLLDLLKKTAIDLVILDISMQNLSGIEATSAIKTTHTDLEVLILSMHKNTEYLHHAFAAGAKGYMLKEDIDTELFPAIKTIRQGGIYVSPLLSKDLPIDFSGT